MREALKQTFLANALEDYLIAFGIIFGGIFLGQIFRRVALKRFLNLALKTSSTLDDFMIRGIDKFIVPFFHFAFIYMGINYLILSKRMQEIVHVAGTILLAFLIIRLVSSAILGLLESKVKRSQKGNEKARRLGGLMIVVNVLIWIIGLIFLFDNLGFNISAVITGLGIGGIAMALAAQNILGDLFNYFVILFDRPFEIGDFIVVDGKMGTVDDIGIKTTRVKSLSGEQLIFSNTDLTNSRIHNFKRMDRRRVVFKVQVVYNTDVETVKTIPAILRSVIEETDFAEIDRANFAALGNYCLEFEVVYYVLSSDYNMYMDVHEKIIIRILEEFTNLGIEFAYPTQSLLLTNNQTSSGREQIGETNDLFPKTKDRIPSPS